MFSIVANKVAKVFSYRSLKYVFRWLYVKRNWPGASPLFALLVIFLLGWGIASSLFPGLVYANSTIMRIIFLVIGAQTCGILVSFVGLPGEKRNFRFLFVFVISVANFFLMYISFLPDMLGMIGFGGEFTQKFHSSSWMKFIVLTLRSHFNPPTVLYKNVGWGNFEGYEKLEAVLRWDAFLRLRKCCNISKAAQGSETEPSKRDFNEFALIRNVEGWGRN